MNLLVRLLILSMFALSFTRADSVSAQEKSSVESLKKLRLYVKVSYQSEKLFQKDIIQFYIDGRLENHGNQAIRFEKQPSLGTSLGLVVGKIDGAKEFSVIQAHFFGGEFPTLPAHTNLPKSRKAFFRLGAPNPFVETSIPAKQFLLLGMATEPVRIGGDSSGSRVVLVLNLTPKGKQKLPEYWESTSFQAWPYAAKYLKEKAETKVLPPGERLLASLLLQRIEGEMK